MKTLSELVRDAYGDAWDKASKYADKYGWILWDRSKSEGVCHYFDLGFDNDEVIIRRESGPITGGVFRWRPIQLHGIDERNGGWNIVETLDDLPKRAGRYKVVYGTGQRPEILERFDPHSAADRRYWLMEVALWKRKEEDPFYFPERLRTNI